MPSLSTDYNPITITLSDGVFTFLGLTDTPSSYSGQSLKFLGVNSAESGLSFFNIETGFGETVNVPSGYSSYVVSGLNLGYAPSFFQVTLMNPSGSNFIGCCQVANTASSSGFFVQFQSAVPTSGYILGWKPIK